MEEQTHYYRYESGRYSMRTTTGEGPVTSPDGATEITQQEYEAGVAALEAASQESRDEAAAAAQVLACEDYAALIAAGLPEASARRMSGCLATPEVNNE